MLVEAIDPVTLWMGNLEHGAELLLQVMVEQVVLTTSYLCLIVEESLGRIEKKI